MFIVKVVFLFKMHVKKLAVKIGNFMELIIFEGLNKPYLYDISSLFEI
jgi:hypothetical protein